MAQLHTCPICGQNWQCTNPNCSLVVVACFSCYPVGQRSGQTYYPGATFNIGISIDDLKTGKWREKGCMEKTLFYIKVKSNFIPTMTAVKQKLGVGHEVVSVEGVKDFPGGITNTETALGAIINTGYKELIRRYHPDVAVKVDPDVIRHLTAAKKQLDELLKRIA